MKKRNFKNIVLLTVDSLRADHLGCYGYKHPTTPNIDRIAKNGVKFSNCFSNSPTTLTSFRSILTSTYPSLYEDRALSNKRTTIAEVLQKNGFETAGFHSNPFLSRYYGYHRGFNFFYDSVFFNQLISEDKLKGKVESVLNWLTYGFKTVTFHVFGKPHESIEGLNRKVLYWLDEKKDDFFLWVHYMDVHYPYFSAKKYVKKFVKISKSKTLQLNAKLIKDPEHLTKKEVERIIGLYDSGINHVDNLIVDIIDRVEKKGILDDTLFIITADHGDEFLDHGSFGHSMTTAYGDTFFKPFFGNNPDSVKAFGTKFGYPPNLYDELLHVPLIFYSPNRLKPNVVDEMVQLMDISPTISDATGVGTFDGFTGQSLLPLIQGEPVRSRAVLSENISGKKLIKKSYRTKDWKLIMNENRKCELYNLKEDPKEFKNVASDNPNKVEELINGMVKERTSAESTAIQKVLKNIPLKI